VGLSIPVGMAEVKVSKTAEDSLSALGLGSCIGVCVYDSRARVAGLAHVMLPDSTATRGTDRVVEGKFADTAVPVLVQRVEALGGRRANLRAAIAGGAQVFSFASSSPALAIGSRNAEAVVGALRSAGIPLLAQDCGGSVGRTVTLDVASGLVRVRVVGGEPVDLYRLG